METAKAALTRGYPRNFETAEQVARAIAQLQLYALPDNYFDTFAARVERRPRPIWTLPGWPPLSSVTRGRSDPNCHTPALANRCRSCHASDTRSE